MRKAPTSSIRDEAIQRAIRATHEKFERALLAEWNASADRATILNAMSVQRYRCRKCGKPVAGIGDICACRARIDQERCVLNPRDTLRKLFQERSRGVVGSVSLGKFVETIGSIAAANDRDLNWVDGQIQTLLPLFKRTCREWIIGICPLPFRHTGLLPAWFKDEREMLPDSELQQSLSVKDTEAELDRIEAEMELYFDEAAETALDQASLQMAQVDRLDPKHVPTRPVRQDLVAAMVATVKRNSPGKSIEQVCQILDEKHCPLREVDKRAGFSNWHSAWKDSRNRNRIKRFISQTRPAAAQKKV